MRIVIGRRLVGIATAGKPFVVSANKIFVDCACCDRSFQAYFDSPEAVDRYTDGQFIRAGKRRGWKISAKGKSFCPSCQRQRALGLKRDIENE